MPGTDDPVRQLLCLHEWLYIVALDVPTRERIIDRDQRWHDQQAKKRDVAA